MVVPMATGELGISDGRARVPAPLRASESSAGQTGVGHDVINANDFVFVEIELKAQA